MAPRSVSVTTTLRRLQQAGLSLRSLAHEAGYDPSLLRRIAKGERAMTPAVAEALASALDSLAARYAEASHAIRAAGRQHEREG
jgi:transcriptional regulator with XRE-family HTH domain